uniref:Cilia- and flagella-associated protein 69 ARM repeats domain-containing protein n=1 Tax=Cuerna arida TaxID=1464854 RepID=A0A1B6FEC5_9HEMI
MSMLSKECKLPETQVTLRRIWEVMRSQDSASQLDRQLILLQTYLVATGDYVMVADLQLIARIISFLRVRAKLNSRYREPLENIFRLLEHPPLMEMASDEILYGHYLVELLNVLGCILLETKKSHRKFQILGIVQSMLISERIPKSKFIPLRSCIKGIEVSDFVSCLANLIAVVGESLYHQAIYCALQICKLSGFSCWTLLIKNTLDSLFVRLTTIPDELMPAVMDTTSELLWKLFKCSKHPEDWHKVPTPSRIALRSLRYVLREEAIVHAHPGTYPDSLNNISAIILKLMHLFPDADYVLSDLIEDITFYATLSEATFKLSVLPYFKDNFYHLQFKRLMLACLAICPVSNLSVLVFRRCKLARCLVAMIEKSSSVNESPEIWCSKNFIELFRSVVPVVLALFDFLREAFLDAGLMEKLVMFLSVHYIEEKSLSDDVALVVVKTIFSLCSRKPNSKTLQLIRDANAVAILLKLCTLIVAEVALTTTAQCILLYTLYDLTCLIENQQEIQIEHSKQFFCLVKSIYQRILNPLHTDSLIDNRLVVAISNFAWEVIVWNKQSVSRFFRCGLVFPHIDIMERSSCSVQLVCLSMLVDLCEYQQCVPYVVTWRGRNGIKFLSILCQIWRSEEERLGVLRDKGGCISDSEKPLMGENQCKLIKSQKNKVMSICDVFGSVRPKICAIVQLLHRHEEVVDLCEEHYRLGHDSLPCEDLITLQLIKTYLPLKMGEIWWEIRHKQGDVLPLDRYLAETLADRYLNWSLSVQRTQLDLLRGSEAQVRGEEQKYYGLIRACQLTAALSALKEVVGVARSSDRQQFLLAHRKLRKGIENSREVDTELWVAFPPDVNLIIVNNKTLGEMRKKSKSSQVPSVDTQEGCDFDKEFPSHPYVEPDQE